jgi:hypothetical protein
MDKHINWDKFKALVHYICHKAEDSSVLGAIKLNKVLWYSDTIHYMVNGVSITGESYIKRQHGPVPRHVVKAIDELVSEQKIARGRVDYFGFVKTEFVAIKDASVNHFSAEEIRVIDESFEHVCLNHTARSISEETHGVVWDLAMIGEEMPYSTVFAANDGEVTEEDLAWAASVLKVAA